MASQPTGSPSEVAILGRLIDPNRDDLPVAAARAILKLDFERSDHRRMHELSLKAQDGALTAEEQAEIDAYEHVGCVLALLHSKARRSLKKRQRKTGA